MVFAGLPAAQPVLADSSSVEQTCPEEVHSCSHSDAPFHFYSTGSTYLPEYWPEILEPEYLVEGVLYNRDVEAEGAYNGIAKAVCAQDTSDRFPTDDFKNGFSEGWYYYSDNGFYPCTEPVNIAADAVTEKIRAIGTVDASEECKKRIDEAREAFEELSDNEKALVSEETLTILTDAEAGYAALKAAAEQAAADTLAADAVTEKIKAIGTVDTSEECKERIDEAREAFEELSENQKALVSEETLAILADAEAGYEALKAAAEQAADSPEADDDAEKTDPVDPVVPAAESSERVDEAGETNEELSEEAQALESEETPRSLPDAAPENESPRDPDETAYEILEGDSGSWTKDSGLNYVLRGSGNYAEFYCLKMDGTPVDAADYSVSSGSTVVELHAGFLQELSTGKHTVTLVWNSGFASAELTVKPASVSPVSPQTGDPYHAALWTALLTVTGCGCVLLAAARGKKRD